MVEKPAHQRGIVLPGREVQRRDTMDITRADERRVGFHQGDGVRGAALGDGLPQRIERRAGGRLLLAESCAAILFLALDGGDNLAVLAVDGNGIRRGRVAVRPDARARVRAELHQDTGQLLIAPQHGAMERAAAELGVMVDQVGTRFGEPPHGRHVTGFGRREECREVHALDVILERGPARKAVGSREHSLRVGQSEIRWIGVPFEALDFGDGCIFAGAVRLEQFLCLLAELGKARLVRESARGRRLRRHDVLLSAAVGRMARCPRREPKEGTLAINSNA